jgi:hypothetical protein
MLHDACSATGVGARKEPHREAGLVASKQSFLRLVVSLCGPRLIVSGLWQVLAVFAQWAMWARSQPVRSYLITLRSSMLNLRPVARDECQGMFDDLKSSLALARVFPTEVS